MKNISTKMKERLIIDEIAKVSLKYKKKNIKGDTKNKFDEFRLAINENKKIEIEYDSYGKGLKKRTINPKEIFVYQGIWCIAGICENKKEIRHFEFKRITDYKVL